LFEWRCVKGPALRGQEMDGGERRKKNAFGTGILGDSALSFELKSQHNNSPRGHSRKERDEGKEKLANL